MVNTNGESALFKCNITDIPNVKQKKIQMYIYDKSKCKTRNYKQKALASDGEN